MYQRVGQSIKTLAVITFVVGTFAYVVSGFICIGNNHPGWGCMMIVFGPLLCFIGSLLPYGFGQLVENSDETVYMLRNMAATPQNSTQYAPASSNVYAQPRFCEVCGNLKSGGVCPVCHTPSNTWEQSSQNAHQQTVPINTGRSSLTDEHLQTMQDFKNI